MEVVMASFHRLSGVLLRTIPTGVTAPSHWKDTPQMHRLQAQLQVLVPVLVPVLQLHCPGKHWRTFFHYREWKTVRIKRHQVRCLTYLRHQVMRSAVFMCAYSFGCRYHCNISVFCSIIHCYLCVNFLLCPIMFFATLSGPTLLLILLLFFCRKKIISLILYGWHDTIYFVNIYNIFFFISF